MPASSYKPKILRVTFVLGGGATFEATTTDVLTTDEPPPANMLTLTGLRTTAVIKGFGAPVFPDATIQIFGMSQSDMNALAAITAETESYQANSITVEADSGQGFVTVFVGYVMYARPDYTAQPDVFFNVYARSLGFQSLKSVAPLSYTGGTDVTTIVSTIARTMGASFHNNGVDQQIDSPYLSGTATEQLRQICDHAGITYYIEPAPDAGKNVTNAAVLVVISPYGEARGDVPTFTLAPDAGLVGYPMRDSQGFVECRALFNPAFRLGGPISLKGSGVQVIRGAGLTGQTANVSLNNVDGSWMIGAMTHTLEAVKFGGAWFTDLKIYPPGSTQKTIGGS